MAKAYWRGYEIIAMGEKKGEWVQIAYRTDWYHSPLTGTSCCWAYVGEIVLEEE